jgi:hypothetical protein
MTDTNLLRAKINLSGYKLKWIAERCGITYAGLLKKINNETEFKASEMYVLKDLLNIDSDEFESIFFAKNVDKMATIQGGD